MFPIGTILAIFDLQSARYFLPSLELIGLSVRKKRKIDFQEARHGGHLRFPIGMILAIFDLHVPPTRMSFESSGLSVQEKKRKIDL